DIHGIETPPNAGRSLRGKPCQIEPAEVSGGLPLPALPVEGEDQVAMVGSLIVGVALAGENPHRGIVVVVEMERRGVQEPPPSLEEDFQIDMAAPDGARAGGAEF